MIEGNLAEFFLNNLTGVGFGLLMYVFATKTVKEQTNKISELIETIKDCGFKKNNQK